MGEAAVESFRKVDQNLPGERDDFVHLAVELGTGSDQQDAKNLQKLV